MNVEEKRAKKLYFWDEGSNLFILVHSNVHVLR